MHRFHASSAIAISVLCLSIMVSAFSWGPQQQPAISVPDYPDSPDGLKRLVEDMFTALRAKDDIRISQYFSSLTIPDHSAWFSKVFGPVEGVRLDAKYAELLPQLASDARRSLEYAFNGGRTDVEIVVQQKAVNETVMGLGRAVIEAMNESVPLYSASGRSLREQYAAFIGRFFYVEGGFRYIDTRVLQALSTAPPLRMRVGGNVQQTKLVRKVDPVYPEDARAARVEGTVALHAIVGTDGSIKELTVVSGDPSLARAAVQAVRQWQYQQTLLNGASVEVDTSINVTFRVR